MVYHGACHCRSVRIEVDGEIDTVAECDCSICQQSGFLHWIVDENQVQVHDDVGSLKTYIWGSGIARHYFCGTCGVAPLRRPRSYPERYGVNVRCLAGVELDGLVIKPVNGRSLPGAGASWSVGLYP